MRSGNQECLSETGSKEAGQMLKDGIDLITYIHLVALWGEGFQINSPFRNDPAEGVVFRGRGRHLNGSRSISTRSELRDSEPDETATPPPSSSASGVAFCGRSNRLGS
ncbi:derlin-1.2-like [Forsythia ovata]|uniref:Derlin-1.2-like n=1 Tax=Forsythia ovata TaxID=205694 RepID=A0ABD1WN17_9LAMI